MLLRFDPVRELDRLHRQIWDDWAPHAAVPAATVPAVTVPVDVYRHEGELVVKVDLPGVDPDPIDVTVDDRVLTVSASREWVPAEDDRVIARQRPHGTFRRQLTLGSALDPERLSARYDLGVLTIHVPVAEAARPRRVAVRTGPQRPAVEAATSGEGETGSETRAA